MRRPFGSITQPEPECAPAQAGFFLGFRAKEDRLKPVIHFVRDLCEGGWHPHPWGIKTVMVCWRFGGQLPVQHLPSSLRAVDQGQGAVGLQQSGITGQACATQNAAGRTL